MQPYTIIFIGPQGSGKGTQIAKMDQYFNEVDPVRRVVDIQTGRRFRALAARQETFAEKKIMRTLNTGDLQPDFLTHLLWGQAMLTQLDPKSHVLIDGIPRTVSQAKVLDEALHFFEREPIYVVNLETPEATVRARMLERARADDTPESIETRLRLYREETVPVIEYYRTRAGVEVIDIDGTQNIGAVHEAIKTGLKLA